MVKLPRLTCQRCGYIWIPRIEGRPQACANPKCRSPYWDKPRKIKKEDKTKW